MGALNCFEELTGVNWQLNVVIAFIGLCLGSKSQREKMRLFKSMPLIVLKSCLSEVELTCCMQKNSQLKQLFNT